MEEIFNFGANLIGDIFFEAISTVSSYYKDKKNDLKYQKLIEKLETGRKDLEKKLLSLAEKKISSNAFIQNEIISKYKTELLISTVNSIFSELNIQNKIKSEIEQSISTYEFTEKLNHFNILILGRAGIGKTTLINSILQFEGTPNELITGEGVSKTLGEPKGYTSDKIKGLRLWDSQGIDKEKYNIPKVVEDVKKLINEASINNDPDKFIHCIWYCISGDRFENSECESISELMGIYDDETLPIIIVYTEAYSEEITEEVCEQVKIILEQKTDKKKIKEINIMPIVAKEKEIKMGNITTKIEKFGINSLIDISMKKISLAINSACFFSFKNKLKKDFEKKINDKKNIITNNIIKTINEFVSGNKISNIISLNSPIIKNKVLNKILETSLNDKSKIYLSKLLKEFQKFIDEACFNSFAPFLSKCFSECIMEYKNENSENEEDNNDNNDEFNLVEKINKNTLDYLLNYKNKKLNNKKKDKISTGPQEDNIYEKIRKILLDNIVKETSKFIDVKICEEFCKLMIDTYFNMINNYDEVMQNKVKDSMNIQSTNLMKNFKFND